jgi:tetratricopeptide (TPR) repeat protein
MISTWRTSRPGRQLWLFLLLLLSSVPFAAQAQQENRLRRIQILPQSACTRINLFFQTPPDFTASAGPGRLGLTVRDADSPLFKKLRGYSDSRIGGVFCSQRYRGLGIAIPVQPGCKARVFSGDVGVLTVLVSRAAGSAAGPEIAAGREPILAGTERFVRDFSGSFRAGLPFVPTRAELLQRFLAESEVKLFQRGEGCLYREQGKEALEVFSGFFSKAPAVQALAWYRTGEALALMQRDGEALTAFRRGEAIWAGYLEQAPELLQVYAELRARNGDFTGGRTLLVRLIGRLCGTVYAPPLLNRLAAMYDRHGDHAFALELYRTVVVHAPGTEAANRARMKLADDEMFTLPRDRYRELAQRYHAIYQGPGDLALRDEALFKIALLHALYGPPREALETTVSYDARYPHGIFSTIVKKMREELLLPVYRELYAAHDQPALVRLALDNREYLVRCFSDPHFPQRLGEAFRGAGMLTYELKLFSDLADRSWALYAAPYLSSRVVDDALALGSLALAQTTGRAFLARFPGDSRTQRVREELGRIAFQRGDLKGVVAELSFLNGKGKKAEFPESDYYLGKALAAAGDQRGAERSLSRFTAAPPSGSPLVTDGFFAVASTRVALREYPAALAAYRQGVQLARGEEAEQFLYKMGELYLKLNMVGQAREAWERVARRGGRGTWVKLASESLGDLEWRLKIAKELP